MNTKINVLDKGFVRLVSYMQPAWENRIEPSDPNCEDKRSWTGDLEVVRNARVSFDADWRTGEDEGKDERLIRFMMRHGHTSPFEAMVFTFEIKAPIFVVRQWHRHRTWSYNEISARYTTLDEGFYYPDPKRVGKQNPQNKQSRDMSLELTPEEVAEREAFVFNLGTYATMAHEAYTIALDHGIPRELARMFLSLNAYTRFFGTVNLHNLLDVFIKERLAPGAQWEIQQYALALLNLVEPICPATIEAFKESFL